jgi:hypothetical protein
MAYETGTATDQHNLLDKIRTFCVTQGWTQNGWADDGTGKRLHLSKNGLYFNFRSAVNERVFSAYYFYSSYAYVTGIALCGSTGYDGGEDWDNQPGGPVSNYSSYTWGVCIKDVSGAIPAYHLFTLGANSVCLVVEYQSGKYQYLVWGELDKSDAGTYTGGQFVVGSRSAATASYGSEPDPLGVFGYPADIGDCPQLAVWMDVDSITEYWWPGGSYVTRYAATTRMVRINGLSGRVDPTNGGQKGLASPLIRATPNAFNGLTSLHVLEVIAEREADKWSYIGRIPNMRMLNMTNYSPGDEITLGSDTWMVFPQHGKADTYPEVGLAVLKVT